MDYLNFNFKVSKNLRLLRSATNMSQHAIASSLGISRSSYCAIEAGRQPLGLYHAIKLSEILESILEDSGQTIYKKSSLLICTNPISSIRANPNNQILFFRF